MRIHRIALSAWFMLFAVTGRVKAACLAHEPFTYALGSAIAGQNGGTGFGSAWEQNNDYGSKTVTAPALAYSTPPTKVSLASSSAGNTSLSRPLSQHYSSGTLYASAILHASSGSKRSFNQSLRQSDNTFVVSFGSMNGFWGLESNGNGVVATTIPDTTLVQLILRLDLTANKADLFVFELSSPVPVTEPATPTLTRPLPDVVIGRVGYFVGGGGQGVATCDADDFRLGETYADVVVKKAVRGTLVTLQ